MSGLFALATTTLMTAVAMAQDGITVVTTAQRVYPTKVGDEKSPILARKIVLPKREQVRGKLVLVNHTKSWLIVLQGDFTHGRWEDALTPDLSEAVAKGEAVILLVSPATEIRWDVAKEWVSFDKLADLVGLKLVIPVTVDYYDRYGVNNRFIRPRSVILQKQPKPD